MKFGALTGLRGVCALIVAISHLTVVGAIIQSHFMQNSYLVVDFFFVLSGFVIAYAYLDEVCDRASTLSFMIRRFGRLYPLHLAVLCALIANELVRFEAGRMGLSLEQQPFTAGYSLQMLVSNLFLAHSIGIEKVTSWNYPSWSISVEFYTYTLFAVVAIATVSLRTSARLFVFGTLMAGAALVPILYSKTGMFVTADYGLFRCIYGFFAGVLTFSAYRASADWRRTLTLNGVWRWLGPAIVEIVFAGAAIGFVIAADIGPLSFAAPIVFAVCVFVFADGIGPISRLLSTPVMQYLGDRSYSIYMVHSFIAIQVVHRCFSLIGRATHISLIEVMQNSVGDTLEMVNLGNPLWGDAVTIVYVGIVIAVSHCSYRWIEVPWRAWFNSAAEHMTARHAAADRARLAGAVNGQVPG